MSSSRAFAEVVRRLRAGGEDGFACLEAVIGPDLCAVISRLQARHLLTDDTPERLYRCSLAGLRIVLARADAESGPADSELKPYLLALAVRLLGPFGHPELAEASQPEPVAPAFGYSVECWSRPVGPAGGDLHKVTVTSGGLLLLVADVTGHSRAAHALARGLDRLWDAAVSELDTAEPADLAERLDAELAGCLPEGMFVEAAVARASRDGGVTVVAAGGVRYAHASAPDQPPSFATAAGFWLGLGASAPRDRVTLELARRGAEVVFATDGVFDQGAGGGASLWDALRAGPRREGDSLYGSILAAYQAAVAREAQADDATLVSLRRA
jgi:hypothetical protein